MNSFEKSQSAKILSCYNNVSDDLKKSGEGSRGGKVIGHTQSGKPVYENTTMHPDYKKFKKQDWKDAAKSHREEANRRFIQSEKEPEKSGEHEGYAKGAMRLASYYDSIAAKKK